MMVMHSRVARARCRIGDTETAKHCCYAGAELRPCVRSLPSIERRDVETRNNEESKKKQ